MSAFCGGDVLEGGSGNGEVVLRDGRGLRRPHRRQTILDAALEVLSEGGPGGFTMDAVAVRADISRPLLYNHFPNREALLLAVVEDYAGFLKAALESAVARAEDLPGYLRATIHAYFDAVGERGVVVRMLLSSTRQDAEVESARRALRRWSLDFHTTTLRSFCHADPATARHVVAMILPVAHEAATMWIAKEITRKKAEELYVQIVTAAVNSMGSI